MKKPHLFSKIVVAWCVFICSALSVWAMYIAARDNYQCTGVLTAALGVFGGELLLLCLKRIFSDGGTRDGVPVPVPAADCDAAGGCV